VIPIDTIPADTMATGAWPADLHAHSLHSHKRPFTDIEDPVKAPANTQRRRFELPGLHSQIENAVEHVGDLTNVPLSLPATPLDTHENDVLSSTPDAACHTVQSITFPNATICQSDGQASSPDNPNLSICPNGVGAYDNEDEPELETGARNDDEEASDDAACQSDGQASLPDNPNLSICPNGVGAYDNEDEPESETGARNDDEASDDDEDEPESESEMSAYDNEDEPELETGTHNNDHHCWAQSLKDFRRWVGEYEPTTSDNELDELDIQTYSVCFFVFPFQLDSSYQHIRRMSNP
jgi:hypothetical protein